MLLNRKKITSENNLNGQYKIANKTFMPLTGATKLEKADTPMGVVLGKIRFLKEARDYEYLISCCKTNKILTTDYPKDDFFKLFN